MPLKSPEIRTSQLAEACFDYLVSVPDELHRFMAESGLSADDLRLGPDSASLATGLFDYFAHNEVALTAMSAASGIPVDEFMRAWSRLNREV